MAVFRGRVIFFHPAGLHSSKSYDRNPVQSNLFFFESTAPQMKFIQTSGRCTSLCFSELLMLQCISIRSALFFLYSRTRGKTARVQVHAVGKMCGSRVGNHSYQWFQQEWAGAVIRIRLYSYNSHSARKIGRET